MGNWLVYGAGVLFLAPLFAMFVALILGITVSVSARILGAFGIGGRARRLGD